MNHKHIRSAIYGVLMLVSASIVSAQEPANLGELLDKGAKRLDAAELKALVIGATVSGMVLREGSTIGFDTTFTDDGKLTGRLYGLRVDAGRGTTGTWNINEKGQLCTESLSVAFGATKNCSVYYSMNNVYYAAASDERSAIARMRKIVR